MHLIRTCTYAFFPTLEAPYFSINKACSSNTDKPSQRTFLTQTFFMFIVARAYVAACIVFLALCTHARMLQPSGYFEDPSRPTFKFKLYLLLSIPNKCGPTLFKRCCELRAFALMLNPRWRLHGAIVSFSRRRLRPWFDLQPCSHSSRQFRL